MGHCRISYRSVHGFESRIVIIENDARLNIVVRLDTWLLLVFDVHRCTMDESHEKEDAKQENGYLLLHIRVLCG